ncbi:MAG TPA: FAD-linked oxidase C-terminal domain-containing protein [Solirubrobacteraceae bacterium]|jgi:glycolate oxidase subunit GlcD|nr:FAD-linked oxidase C-terminal domain-containing protein [Solirubrobacteraceae bacterium]
MRSELSRLVGAEHVLEAPPQSPYNRDATGRRGIAGRADAVVLPGSAGEVAAVVSWCYAHDVPIVPRGGGTGLAGGAVAIDGGVVCSLERMRAVRELEPALWRIFPEAGVSTRHVQRLARENGLLFAPDPGAAEQSQIGGNVATNAGGPHALKYGVTGAWVAGLEAVLAPGELVRLGGWAGKDVAGYDLKSLLIGSEGTLGVITAVMLRLLPAPEAAIPLVAFLRSAEEGCGAIEAVFAAGLRPSVLDFLDRETLTIVGGGYPGGGRLHGPAAVPSEAGFALIVELDGRRSEALAARDELIELLSGTAVAIDEPTDVEALWRWRDGVNGVVTAERGMKVSEDVVFPVDRLREGLEGFSQIAGSHGLRSCAWGHGGEGNVHATVLVDPASEEELEAAEAAGGELFALVVALGGSVAGEHGLGWIKRGLLASQWKPRAVEAHEQIKRVFDPKDLLNPGKKLARYPARSPARSE